MIKVDLMPVPPEEISGGLYSVIGGALAGGAPIPEWVAVDDGTDAWVVATSARPFSERVRGVVAVSGEEALVTAQRLGIGGAMWLPPSSLGALEAFESANSAEVRPAADVAALGLAESGEEIRVVSPAHRSFWRAQLGDRALTGLLAELSAALAAPASILPWPALVVADRSETAIVDTWTALGGESDRILPEISVLTVRSGEPGVEVLDAAYIALLEASAVKDRLGNVEPRPVHELPHGRRVGWWCLDSVEEGTEDGWVAAPVEVNPTSCRWQLDGNGRSGVVEDVLTSERVARLEDVVAARIPGWACQDLRAGSPAALLTARIAEAAARKSIPLWIPGIDSDALRFVLGLPGTIWVDGPAVPR